MALTEKQVFDALPSSGFLSNYVAYASRRTDSHAINHVACGLALLTQTVPPDLVIPFGSRTFPNLYVLLVGESTESRKTAAIEAARDVLMEILPEAVVETPGSWEGLLDGLQDRPQQLIFYPEFGAFLSGAEKGYARPIKERLTEVYDCVPVSRRTVTGRKAGRKGIINPRLSLLCGCSPAYLERYTEESDWTGGFEARFFSLLTVRERFYKKTPPPDPMERARIAALLQARLLAWQGDLSGIMPRMCSGLTEGADRMWDEWADKVALVVQRAPRATKAAVGRSPTMAQKIATLIAWDTTPGAWSGEEWQITEETIALATWIVDQHNEAAVTIGGTIANDRDMRDRRRVFAATRAIPTPFGEIIRSAELTKRRAQDMIHTLLEEGAIVQVSVEGQPGAFYMLRGLSPETTNGATSYATIPADAVLSAEDLFS